MYTIKGRQLLTYGREDFPVYCAHEPLMELQDIKAHGASFVVIEPAQNRQAALQLHHLQGQVQNRGQILLTPRPQKTDAQ
jgi:hypothetical protein